MRKQKVILWACALAFLTSLFWSPFVVLLAGQPRGHVWTRFWTPNGIWHYENSLTGQLSLDWKLLVAEWVLIGGVAVWALLYGEEKQTNATY
jgi:hypothetical protein